MKAMILAAGFGTRLKPLTEQIPKPMIPLGGVPNILRIIWHLKDQGVDDFVINLHHNPEPLQAYLQDGSQWDVRIRYSLESPEILGTGGGIKKMIPMIGKETFVVMNGDVLFMPELAPLMEAHKRNRAMSTMVVRKDPNAEKLGAVGVVDGKVKRLVGIGDLRVDDLYMFTGMHIMEPTMLNSLPENGCVVRQTYIPMVKQRHQLGAVVSDAYFCDMGTPESYLEANAHTLSGAVALPRFSPPPEGVLTDNSATVGKNAVITKHSYVGEGAHIEPGCTVRNAIIMPGARVIADAINCIVCSDGRRLEVV